MSLSIGPTIDINNVSQAEMRWLELHMPMTAIDAAGNATFEFLDILDPGGYYPPRLEEDQLVREVIPGISLTIDISTELRALLEGLYQTSLSVSPDWAAQLDYFLPLGCVIWAERSFAKQKYDLNILYAQKAGTISKFDVGTQILNWGKATAKTKFTSNALNEETGLTYQQVAALYGVDSRLTKDEIFDRVWEILFHR